MPSHLTQFYYAQISPILGMNLIDVITATPKINLNGLLAMHQDVVALSNSDKKSETLDLGSVKVLL